ncbi:MAG: NCS2 family permease [Candidatus Micrarchaeota archaeon]|nr:NCS2 family permease [Candidatus Micrarchaeota archaeon]
MVAKKKEETNIRVEVIAGLTTFFTMAYILIINPTLMSNAGIDFQAVFIATAISAGICSIIMGVFANRPLALASGMGLNAYFVYSVLLGSGLSFGTALVAVFVASLLVFLLALSKIKISDAISDSFKHALIAGLGLFLVFIGMQNAHFVETSSATVVTLGNLLAPKALIAILGLFLTTMLITKRVNGAMLIAIMLTTTVAMAIGLTPMPEKIFELPIGFEKTFMKLDFSALTDTRILPVIWTFFIISFFDIVGTLTALLAKAGYVDKKGKVKGLENALTINGLSGMIGAAFGVPTIITYLENASGIEAGGKTGKVAIVVGLLFLISVFFFPLIKSIPIEAAAPAIIITGIFMATAMGGIKLDDNTEAIPALLTIATIPFTFSISHGIGVGAITYVFLKLVTMRHREIHPVMYIIALFSILEFAKVF